MACHRRAARSAHDNQPGYGFLAKTLGLASTLNDAIVAVGADDGPDGVGWVWLLYAVFSDDKRLFSSPRVTTGSQSPPAELPRMTLRPDAG